jgi:hypothetical protein
MKRLKPVDIAHRRIVELAELKGGAGEIWAHGKRFLVTYDDLLDVVQAVEMIMLKLTGKVLAPKFRPEIKNRAALKVDHFFIADYSRYDGAQGPAALEAHQVCPVTERLLTTHYMHCQIDDKRWDTWFCRLDELIKALYGIVKEAQADVREAKPMVAFQFSTEQNHRMETGPDAQRFMTGQVGHG